MIRTFTVAAIFGLLLPVVFGVGVDDRVLPLGVAAAALDPSSRHKLSMTVREDNVNPVICVAAYTRGIGCPNAIDTVEPVEIERLWLAGNRTPRVIPVLKDPGENGLSNDGNICHTIVGATQSGERGEPAIGVENVLVV